MTATATPVILAGVNDEPSPEWDLDEGLSVLDAAGIRHVALRAVSGRTVDAMDDDAYRDVVARVRERGFVVLSYLSRIGSGPLDPSTWPQERAAASRAFERARAADCRGVRVMAYKRGDCPGPERYPRTVERIGALTAMAESAGVTLLLETIFPPWQSIGGSAAGCLRLVREIDSPHLRVCLDPGNLAADGEDPVLATELLAPYVADVHIKDARRFGSRADGFCLPDEGVCDWPYLLRVLRGVGYTGPFTLEPHLAHTERHHVTGREGFLAAAVRARELLAAAGYTASEGR